MRCVDGVALWLVEEVVVVRPGEVCDCQVVFNDKVGAADESKLELCEKSERDDTYPVKHSVCGACDVVRVAVPCVFDKS